MDSKDDAVLRKQLPLSLTCVVRKGSCLVVPHARVGINEEEVHGTTTAQAELEVSFTVPPPVLLPQGDVQLQHHCFYTT